MISQTGPNWKTLGQGFVFDVIPISVIVMLIAAVILWVLLDQTVVGRKFYALGGSREAARACGINLKKYVILAYALSGLFIGLAGVLYTSRANCGVATGAQGYEGQAISATVIGGIGFAIYIALSALEWRGLALFAALAFGLEAGYAFLSALDCREKDKDSVSYNIVWGTGALAILMLLPAVMTIIKG